MATDFIDAFRRLQPHERGQALETLATELTPYEWRALHAITATRTFQADIIAKLPLELATHVFSYLDVAAPYRLRTVSKHWNHILGSLHILKTGLDQWYQGTADLRDARHALCEREARAIHAFRTGKPTIIFRLNLNPDKYTEQFMLTRNHLVWDTYEGGYTRDVCILNLDTWQLRRVCGEAREDISRVFVSDEIVVLATHSIVSYVYELQGGQVPKKFRTPSMEYYRNVACCDRTVACVGRYSDHTSVFIWEYNTQRGRSFDINHGAGGPDFEERQVYTLSTPGLPNCHHRGCHNGPYTKLTYTYSKWSLTYSVTPLLQPEAETIILFSSPFDRLSGHKGWIFYRYNYSGECIGKFNPTFLGLNDVLPWPPDNSFVPANYNRSLFTMRIRAISNQGGHIECQLQIDEKANVLRVWRGYELATHPDMEYNSMAWWNDTYYGSGGSKFQGGPRDLIAYMGTNDTQSYKQIISGPKDSDLDLDENDVMANGKYVVLKNDDSFYILCFDDNDISKRPQESDSFFGIGTLKVVKPESNPLKYNFSRTNVFTLAIMVEKVYVTYNQVHKLCQEAADQILNEFKPTLMIAIGGGGYVPAPAVKKLGREGEKTNFSIFVLHNKDKPKKGQLPQEILKGRYIAARTVGDVWINYPWEATDIEEHDRLSRAQETKS
ncbi:xanthine phosphoribosyltransferase 1 [Pyrenophora seminiperda CCB06]|uniref:Xanthine phosphoribosyltransferase 1 n=1 Tax=Pyrenophora seminiperda CCB06 TaxID=1302712 RepID=A0A3M7MAN4_9PLEO|nr:xanthine phosphoribosyltransferase 1 [Pyrenophora seminiperda CCB06]